MLYEDLKVGDVFGIEGTISYPKLKLENGYVDMRDEILNSTGNTVKGREVQILSSKEITEELGRRFEMDMEDIEIWIKETKEKYLLKIN
jgi:hypothetical protein